MRYDLGCLRRKEGEGVGEESIMERVRALIVCQGCLLGLVYLSFSGKGSGKTMMHVSSDFDMDARPIVENENRTTTKGANTFSRHRRRRKGQNGEFLAIKMLSHTGQYI